jgi:hypothetical protein
MATGSCRGWGGKERDQQIGTGGGWGKSFLSRTTKETPPTTQSLSKEGDPEPWGLPPQGVAHVLIAIILMIV